MKQKKAVHLFPDENVVIFIHRGRRKRGHETISVIEPGEKIEYIEVKITKTGKGECNFFTVGEVSGKGMDDSSPAQLRVEMQE